MAAERDGSDEATLLRRKPDLSGGMVAAFVLTVSEGVDAGKVFALDGSAVSPVLLGTSPACELKLSDPAVSRRHAALEVSDGRLRVTDVGSTNGTYVGAIAIGEAYLVGGEILRLGGTAIAVASDRVPASPGPAQADRFGKLIGASEQMRGLYPLCARLAASTVPVIIEGETGTGKEVLAESLHELGPRANAPFVVFDCTAVPPNLVESELFGHERGAFTGAIGLRKGVFEQADGGSLFIDEIGDLDLALQPKLLRAIERSEVRRVGGDRWIKTNVRLLAATRRNLDREVQLGRFRDDLFHRLAVGRVELPPLRRRRGDVPVLARHFWQALGGAASGPPANNLERWQDYAWPGNARELRNAVARLLELGDLEQPRSLHDQDTALALSEDFITKVITAKLPLIQGRQRVIDEFERRYIARILADNGGSIAKAASASGIARRYFQLLRARTREP